MIWGIDVSRWQGVIDWAQVARAGVRFAWCKATEGVTHVDPTYHRNVARAREAGIAVGAYHFARPGDPETQLAHLRDVIRELRPGDLPVALDLEDNAVDDPARFALRWLSAATLIWGRAALYTYEHYWNRHLAQAVALRRWPLWIARYGSREPSAPWTVWQYTSDGSVTGIHARVDMNRFRGDEEAFRAFRGLPPTALAPEEEDDDDMARSDYFLVQRKGESAVYLATPEGIRRPIPNPYIRDVLAFSLGPVKVIDDDRIWRYLTGEAS